MYQAFARKYRPQTWGTVLGQGHITTTLKNALTAGRLHHAYLFTGARGVGKTTVARILAKAVNCTGRESSSAPCNTCTHCVDITDGRSMDIQEIDGASNTSVDDVREIRERVKYLPAAGRYRVYIIDEVHMLSNAAFNALLKTLEEPPAHVIFIFATTEPEKIPATILSRCQRYDFRRISVAATVSALQDIAAREGVTVTSDVLHLLAYEAEGSLRDAESLFDQAVAFAGAAITVESLRNLLGFTDRRMVMALCEQVVARNAAAVLDMLEESFQNGVNLHRLAQEILEVFRHVWIIASCGGLPTGDELPEAEVEQLRALSGRAALPEFHQWFALCYRGGDEIARARFPKLAMEALLLQMVQVGPAQPVDALIERVEQLMRGEVEHRPAPVVIANPEGVKQSSPPPGEIVAPAWSTFLDALRVTKPQVASIFEHGELVEATAERVELRYPQGSIYGEMLKEADRLALSQQLVRAHFGDGCRLVVTPTAGPPAAAARQQARYEKQQRQHEAHTTATQHALVKEAANIFGAEIKEVKTHESDR